MEINIKTNYPANFSPEYIKLLIGTNFDLYHKLNDKGFKRRVGTVDI